MKRPALLLLIAAASLGGGSAQTCGGGANAGNPCADPNQCCSQWGNCNWFDDPASEQWCSPAWSCSYNCWDSPDGPPTGPSPPTTPPPQPAPSTPPPAPSGPTTYNYCGVDYNDSLKCGATCPDGIDSQCTGSEKCFLLTEELCPSGPTPPPAPTNPPTPLPTRDPSAPVATADGDSRVAAYVGNWNVACPSDAQIATFTHVIVAFAHTYTWTPSKTCSPTCQIGNLDENGKVHVCQDSANQAKVDAWRAAGKKVILSFGGGGMGGSWSTSSDDCWNACFGREEELSTKLVNLVELQNFDGIDIDYEYCYDVAGGRHGRNCNLDPGYSDAAAQNFLRQMTDKLRDKLDTLSQTTGKHYELSHVPMDSDLDRNRYGQFIGASPYYNILKEKSALLDYIGVQFYNGYNNPVTGGFSATSATYADAVDDIMGGRADKVLYGFCLSSCGSFDATSAQAVTILGDAKTYDQQQYACNGGTFFWASYLDDASANWSSPVSAEVQTTSGCSATGTPAPSTSPTARPTATPGPTSSPSKSPTGSPSRPPSSGPTSSPSQSPTAFPTEQFPGTCSDGSGSCAEGDTSTCTCHAGGRKLLRTGRLTGIQQSPAKTGKLLRSVLKGASRSSTKIERGLKKTKNPPPTSPPTPPPTPPPVDPTTPGPTSSPTSRPTDSPTPPPVDPPTPPPVTPSPTCTCIMPTPPPVTTPPPTPPPTSPPTPPPTSPPTSPPTPPPVGSPTCNPDPSACSQFTQMNECKNGCDQAKNTADDCSWTGSSKTCGPP